MGEETGEKLQQTQNVISLRVNINLIKRMELELLLGRVETFTTVIT